MTLADLIATYRADANDKVQPYFASDEEVTGWLNEAVVEAAIRGRLIHESSASMCRITVTAGKSVYPINPALYELTHTAFREDGKKREPVMLASEEWLDRNVREWRDEKGRPAYAVQSDKALRLIPEPDRNGELLIEGYRLPIIALEADDLDGAPEILAAHHRYLVYWVLHRAFSIPDAEFFDPTRATEAEREFTKYFGARPDSDLRRITREDVEHHVIPYWV